MPANSRPPEEPGEPAVPGLERVLKTLWKRENHAYGGTRPRRRGKGPNVSAGRNSAQAPYRCEGERIGARGMSSSELTEKYPMRSTPRKAKLMVERKRKRDDYEHRRPQPIWCHDHSGKGGAGRDIENHCPAKSRIRRRSWQPHGVGDRGRPHFRSGGGLRGTYDRENTARPELESGRIRGQTQRAHGEPTRRVLDGGKIYDARRRPPRQGKKPAPREGTNVSPEGGTAPGTSGVTIERPPTRKEHRGDGEARLKKRRQSKRMVLYWRIKGGPCKPEKGVTPANQEGHAPRTSERLKPSARALRKVVKKG